MSEGTSVSRREFLKIAGIAGATIGVGAGLGGLVAACGQGATTTTTAAAGSATTAPAGTTTTGVASTTTVSAAAEVGRPIKLGLVTPETGNIAVFGIADKWWVPRAEKVQGDGILCGDGKVHKLLITSRDSHSDASQAALVAGDLIQNDKVDVLMAGGTPSTADVAADQAEAFGCPGIFDWTIAESFQFGRGLKAPTDSFKWTYAWIYNIGISLVEHEACFAQVPNNKKLGLLLANDTDGNAWAQAAPPFMKAKGYTVTFPSQYQPMSDDFTTQISAFKKDGCELLECSMLTPDFANFWRQALQQGFHPKVAGVSVALLFPGGLTALGDTGYNLCTQGGWNPDLPFKDSVTGQSCQELAAEFEQSTGQQWDQTVGSWVKFEWMVDVFKRVKNVDDKNEIVGAIASTKMDTCMGHMDFTAPVDMNGLHTFPNICRPLGAAVQWVKGKGKYKYDQVFVWSQDPNVIPVAQKVLPLEYTS